MKKVLYATLIASLAWLGSTQAQQATYAYSVKQCIEYGISNNNKVKNALLDEEIAAAKVNEITGSLTPQVNGSFDLKDFIEIPTTIIPAGAFGPNSPQEAVKFGLRYNAVAGLDATQIIFDGGYFLGLKASKVYKELSKKATSRSKEETAVAVSKAYYSVLVNEVRLNLVKANLERLKSLYDDTKAMYENGTVEKLDNDRATLSYSNMQVEYQKVQQFVAVSYLLLKFQMGMSMDSQLSLTDTLSDTDIVAGNGKVVADKIDYNKRTEYELAKIQENLMALDLKRNKYSRLPSIAGYGSLSTNALRNTFDLTSPSQPWFPTGLIGAKLTIPILGGYQRGFRIQQARMSLEKSSNDVKNLQLAIDLEVKSASITYLNSTSMLDAQKKNMDLANEVYNTTKIKYDQGVGSNLEVVTAETSLKEAQTNYYSALYDALIAKVDLDKATGIIKY